ncbi:MAG TPA: dihydrolipoamide acetyltransferase family protein [Tepidisphaeraceae bacterium]|jgi:pyruvate dehydrogenase E2 component (dihydrolipoamide acetyltransferase)
MPTEITMPQLSDTMTEGTLVKWLIKEGDAVKANQTIAEVETDKATMEMESFEGGTVLQLTAKEGDKIAIGGVIALLGKAGEKVEAKKPAAPAPASTPAKATPAIQPAAVQPTPGGSVTMSVASAPVYEGEQPQEQILPKPAGALGGAAQEPQTLAAHNSTANGDRIKASPLARRVAADRGVDLSGITGSGPGGRIVQADVLSAQPGKSPSTPAPELKPAAAPVSTGAARVASGAVEKIPLTKMRATIASRLQASKQTIPHIYLSVDIDMESVNALREKLNQQLEKQKIRISVADFVAKASAAALKSHPGVNAHFDEKNNQIIRYGDVHLGNAVALPDGLIVPVLRSVDQMGLKEIRTRSAELFDRAKQQKLKREEMSGATFTITNLGLWGIKEFAAIVNPPEVAILAVAAAEKRAVVVGGQIVARSIMTVTLSADHRAVDGALAADFLKTLKSMLEEPAIMLV